MSWLNDILTGNKAEEVQPTSPTFYMFVTWAEKNGVQTSSMTYPVSAKYKYTNAGHWCMPDPYVQALIDSAKVIGSKEYFKNNYSDRDGYHSCALFVVEEREEEPGWSPHKFIPNSNEEFELAIRTYTYMIYSAWKRKPLFGCLMNAGVLNP